MSNPLIKEINFTIYELQALDGTAGVFFEFRGIVF